MGKAQRTKGATYEREVASAFTEALGLFDAPIARNIGQARDGGNDLDVGPLVVECKRRKSLLTFQKWLAQAGTAAQRRAAKNNPRRCAHLPAVVCRADHGDSLVVMRLEDFLAEFGENLAKHTYLCPGGDGHRPEVRG